MSHLFFDNSLHQDNILFPLLTPIGPSKIIFPGGVNSFCPCMFAIHSTIELVALLRCGTNRMYTGDAEIRTERRSPHVSKNTIRKQFTSLGIYIDFIYH